MRSEITGRRKERIKNRNNPRYLITHRRYLVALGKLLRRGKFSRIGVKELSKRTRVWKSTFYDHFIHMDDAIEQFWHEKNPELKQLAAEIAERDLTLRKIYTRILVFIYHNREYYDVIVSCRNYISLREILEIFRPLISTKWSRYESKKIEYAFTILTWEFAGEIFYWGKIEKFDFNKILKHSQRLARLSENATQRLA